MSKSPSWVSAGIEGSGRGDTGLRLASHQQRRRRREFNTEVDAGVQQELDRSYVAGWIGFTGGKRQTWIRGLLEGR